MSRSFCRPTDGRSLHPRGRGRSRLEDQRQTARRGWLL